jgi:alanine racemase
MSGQRAVAVVDLGAVERNCATLASRLEGGARLCAVVKADGYGHGAVACARAALAGGASWIAVATAAEAAELRAELPDARLLVMGALAPEELDVALEVDADVAVWRRAFLDLVRERAGAAPSPPRLHVKWGTGMGRLGERDVGTALELLSAIAAADDVDLAGFWTHFATADEPGSEFFATQLERFASVAQRLRDEHPDLILHAANSAATLIEARSHFDMVRCGIAIYGLDPFQEDPAARGLEPALALHSYVADVKRFEAGESAGYGRSWRAREATHVGVLPVGYGDGVRRALSNDADVLVDGFRYPIVGTISMDNLTIDLGPDALVSPGAPAVLIGAAGEDRILAEELARSLGTINYEITCGISARVPREYVR